MIKIKNIYYDRSDKLDKCNTGLYLEAEDGSWYSHASADPVKPFNRIVKPAHFKKLTK